MRKIHIHPLFLLWGIHLMLTGRMILFWHILLLWGLQEGTKALYGNIHGIQWKKLLFTPLGLRMMGTDSNGVTKKEKISLYLAGSAGGFACSVCLFALEYKGLAALSLFLAVLRLLPVLPLDGGHLILWCMEKKWGTLRSAGWLTKVGRGAAYGCILSGILFEVLFPYEFSLLLVGFYLLYVNKREFLRMAKAFYFSMLTEEEKPLREITVTGEESPLEMAVRLNRENTAVFLRKDQKGVSQERVLLAFFLGRSKEWLWQAAEKGEKDFRAKPQDFGYDEKEVKNQERNR